MDVNAVPQEGNAAFAGQRKLMYARAADGRIVGVPSAGWEAEETVTLAAVDALAALTEDARQRVHAGSASPLEYWMHARRMDLALLAQSSGLWRWRVRRHLTPAGFAKLGPPLRARYAAALGIAAEALNQVP